MAKANYSKVGKRSIRKGKTYERRCAKLLTEFTNVNFRKTPGSGGFNRQGGVSIREELFCGDLICDKKGFRYCIEAKNRDKFSFTALLKSPETATFTKWWYQCVNDAKGVNLKPLMFFKPNNRDDFIVMTQHEWDNQFCCNKNINCPYISIMCYGHGKPMTFIIKERWAKKTEKITITLPQAVMVDWKQFVKYYSPKLMFKETING